MVADFADMHEFKGCKMMLTAGRNASTAWFQSNTASYTLFDVETMHLETQPWCDGQPCSPLYPVTPFWVPLSFLF